MADPFIAEIRIFAGNFAPRNWAFCNGQLLPIAQNTALFAILGATYGGDAETVVALPNLQGRAAMHAGNGPGLTPRALGQSGGAETATLTADQLPAHTHALGANAAAPANDDDPGPTAVPGVSVGANMYGPASNLVAMATEAVGSTGGGQAHPNLQPYLALYYIIALQGVFPTRN